MKRIISTLLMLTLVTVSLFGCVGAPDHFEGEWKFSKITKVELIPDVTEDAMELLKEQYGAQDEAGVVAGALASFTADEAFLDFYLNFDGKNTYTYDPFVDREAPWVFYQTGENEGFISFYAELDVSEGNPDPVSCPEIRYEADTNTMYIALSNYGSFMITLELTR